MFIFQSKRMTTIRKKMTTILGDIGIAYVDTIPRLQCETTSSCGNKTWPHEITRWCFVKGIISLLLDAFGIGTISCLLMFEEEDI